MLQYCPESCNLSHINEAITFATFTLTVPMVEYAW